MRALAIANDGKNMCRNIRTLYNFQPPANDEEIRASALQFVRKLSGFARPSKANQQAFTRAVEQVAQATRELIDSLGHRCSTPRSRRRGREGAREGSEPFSTLASPTRRAAHPVRVRSPPTSELTRGARPRGKSSWQAHPSSHV